MEHTSEDGSFGFYIADNAPPTAQLEMRVMALHEEHREFYDRLREGDDGNEISATFTDEEYDTFIKSLDKGLEDIHALYATALTNTPALVEPEEFSEALTHVNGLRLHLLHGKAMQNAPTPN